MIRIKPQIYPELTDSFKFYIMLSIVLSNGGSSDAVAEKALVSFIRDLRKSKQYSDEVISANVNASYKGLPSEFLSLYNIPSVRDGITFIEKGFWKRRMK